MIRLGKVQENLEKDSPRSLVFLWYERLHGIGAQVIMELVHMHEGLVLFRALGKRVSGNYRNLSEF